MTRSIGLRAVAWALALGAAGGASGERPEWPERWIFNPRERTEQAIAAAERGEVEATVEPLETALRLEQQSPVAKYNAGTARLAAGRSGALALLRAAAAPEAGPDLLTDAWYNLGNAKLKESDYPGAIEAFVAALRQRPEFADAKFNLELARRLLEEQQSEGGDSQDQEDEQQQEEQQEEQQQEQQPQASPPEPEGDDRQDPGRQEERQSPLPQFRDLPDMTAEEAAAILEAVENMERERRRKEALEAARANPGGEKDW